jgi:hypothetical protein
VIAGGDELRQDAGRDRQLARLVVVEKAVARLRIPLDVVLDARGGQRRLEALRVLAQAGPPILSAVAGDDRAGA